VISHGRAQRIRTVPLWHTTELPERFLNALTESFKRFRKTQRDRFHIAVCQHAVEQCVVESRSGDCHAEVVADGEVARSQSARMMNLAEVNRLVRPVKTTPCGDAPFECSPSGIRKPTGVCFLKPLEQRLGLQSRFFFEFSLNFGPNIHKWVKPCPVVPMPLPLGRQPLVVTVITCRFFSHFRHPC
jgi:hypothetical protein